MYTYSSFESGGSFTLLQPLFTTILFAVIIVFILVVMPKRVKGKINGLTAIGISIFSFILAGQVVYFEAIIADEINLGGGGLSLFLFGGIFLLGVANIIICLMRQENKPNGGADKTKYQNYNLYSGGREGGDSGAL
ncbi:hypothetical protein BACCIP111883_03262 [Sutcliffiella rhizosphaerae]|uniref:Uncharacterized protein n=2 Tax=Sutcliffiella rhizosphaerae TaxID=2880967 RepID=A0ABN8AB91_9BACI|nr:hypothetical protein BACCIP111883_03262 [Sutcliffiella rhizosphaerae]